MAAGLPDLVDCARLAEDGAVLERVYELERVAALAGFAGGARGADYTRGLRFRRLPRAGRGRALRSARTPQLICQRCMQGFAFPVSGGSEIEFSDDEEAAGSTRSGSI